MSTSKAGYKKLYKDSKKWTIEVVNTNKISVIIRYGNNFEYHRIIKNIITPTDSLIDYKERALNNWGEAIKFANKRYENKEKQGYKQL